MINLWKISTLLRSKNGKIVVNKTGYWYHEDRIYKRILKNNEKGFMW
jgi:hypothetical protein